MKFQKFKQIVFFPFYDYIIHQARVLLSLLHYFSMHENPFAALVLIENGNFLGGCTSVIISESSVMSLSSKPLLNDTRAMVIVCWFLVYWNKTNKQKKNTIKHFQQWKVLRIISAVFMLLSFFSKSWNHKDYKWINESVIYTPHSRTIHQQNNRGSINHNFAVDIMGRNSLEPGRKQKKNIKLFFVLKICVCVCVLGE